MSGSLLSKSIPDSAIRLAISTCPNDTFAFHAILEKKIDLQGLEFDIQLLDIQQLNDGLFHNQFDVAKASFHAAALLADRTIVLRSGSALGFGVGPLLLASKANSVPADFDSDSYSPALTLCPGEHTTAAMLFQLFYGSEIREGKTRVEQTLFSDIMPRLKESTADFGVCIHEGRFTWQDEGLFLVEDLGTRWEQETDSPLPLGGILASRELDSQLQERIQAVIKSSIQYGLAHRDETLVSMRKYAQACSDDVLFSHVDLYVNQWTIELGEVGRRALSVLSAKAKDQGIIPYSDSNIEVLAES
jgi:1,4-dihydroxy-6-naphthoate synthase